jgi:transposase
MPHGARCRVAGARRWRTRSLPALRDARIRRNRSGHKKLARIWAAHGLKPHRVRTFKLSNDAKFAAKVQDVVGLYIDPPEHALVLVMPAPLSRDLRERIVQAVEGGSSMRGAAARFAVSPSSAIKLMARVRATGSSAPARYGGHRRPLLAPHEDLLRELVEERPDITLAEIQAELRRERGIAVCLATIHVSLRRLGLRHKKKA